MKRKFVVGDLVRHKLGGPIMEVITYEIDRKSHLNQKLHEEDVICMWYDKGVINTSVFDDRLLTKFEFFDVLESDSTE